MADTLRKINYTNIEQFLEDVNSNFAIIQNSPLYKGIPGEEGEEGEQGLMGIRGTKFLFVNFSNFNNQFPNELVNQSEINLTFINQKLLSFSQKQKLLLALGVNELVDSDIIVLTNSMMLSYNFVENKFINTGIAFNENINLASSIETQIESYVQYYVDNNQTILNLQNVFERYSTLAKNYTDNNSTFITNSQTASSVYSPYILGYTTNNGVSIPDHKYFGFSDQMYPKTQKGSIVFGSMKKYIDLLMATTSTVQSQTLTSDYAPGQNNIPSAIYLQDTLNAGLMFGYKGRPNLKSFGHIYKDTDDNIVIKSDSSILATEYSNLLINKNRLKYNKLVQFEDSLEVSKNISFGGNLDNKFLRTSQYVVEGDENTIEIGIDNTSSIQKNISQIIKYTKYLSNVLVTDSEGNISHNYGLETATWNTSEELYDNPIVMAPNSTTNVVTSNYLGFLIRKINNLNVFNSENYWNRSQFDTGIIPGIRIGDSFIVNSVGNIGFGTHDETGQPVSYFNLIKELRIGTNGATKIRFVGTNLIFNSFINKVLVTDATGTLSSAYSLDSTPMTEPEVESITSYNKIISGAHFKFLYDKILASGIPNYWTKTEFETNIIPRIYISSVFSGPKLSDSVMSTTLYNENKIEFYHATALNKFNSSNINFDKFKSKVLVTDAYGNLSSDYSLESETYPDKIGLELITENPTSETKIINSSYINWLVNRINSLASYASTNYWTKTDLNGDDDMVSKLSAGTIEAITNFNLANKIVFNNPADELRIGANVDEAGQLKINYSLIQLPSSNFAKKILSTDTNGYIINELSISSYNDEDLTTEVPARTTDELELVVTSGFNINKIIGEKQLHWVMNIINNIKIRLKNTYNKNETDALVESYVPPGTIMLWPLNTMNGVYPDGWQLCDGLPIKNPTQAMCDAQSTLTPVTPTISEYDVSTSEDLLFLFKYAPKAVHIIETW